MFLFVLIEDWQFSDKCIVKSLDSCKLIYSGQWLEFILLYRKNTKRRKWEKNANGGFFFFLGFEVLCPWAEEFRPWSKMASSTCRCFMVFCILVFVFLFCVVCLVFFALLHPYWFFGLREEVSSFHWSFVCRSRWFARGISLWIYFGSLAPVLPTKESTRLWDVCISGPYHHT